MILAEEEARRIAAGALRIVRADGALATLEGRTAGRIRFARNEPVTAGEASAAGFSITVFIGRKTGAASTNRTDPDSIEAAVRGAEAIARLSPEDPEYVAPLGPQTYAWPEAWSPSTAGASPELRARLAAGFLEEARARGLVAAGFCETEAAFKAVAATTGLFAYHRQTRASISGTVRTPDERRSGWAEAVAADVSNLDPGALGRSAAGKAAGGGPPREAPPGRYTVILEPAAVAGLVGSVFPLMDARAAAEGRSAFSRPGGETAVEEKIAGDGIALRSDPASASSPSCPFDDEGFPFRPTAWIERGILKALPTTRHWAARTGVLHRPAPQTLLMEGGDSSVEAMIRETPRGLLVTRLWSPRLVDPRTLLLTGLTRDGLFLIEGGMIAGAVRDLRFNESPLRVLAFADRIGPATLVRTGEGLVVETPALRSHEFEFSGASDAL